MKNARKIPEIILWGKCLWGIISAQLGASRCRQTKGVTQLTDKENFLQGVTFDYGEGLVDDIKILQPIIYRHCTT